MYFSAKRLFVFPVLNSSHLIENIAGLTCLCRKLLPLIIAAHKSSPFRAELERGLILKDIISRIMCLNKLSSENKRFLDKNSADNFKLYSVLFLAPFRCKK